MTNAKIKDFEVRFDPEQDICDQVKKLIEKKKRNMEKRKNKLEEYKKRSEKGEKLLAEQDEALRNYAGVMESLQTLQSLIDQIQQLYAQQARWLKKERKTSLKKTAKSSKEQTSVTEETESLQEPPKKTEPAISTVVTPPAAPVVDTALVIQQSLSKQARIFRLLQCFGEEDVRQTFLNATEENRSNLANLATQGLVPVQQTDLDWLDATFELLNPLSEVPDANPLDVFGCSVALTTREVTERLIPSNEHWTGLLQRKNSPMMSDGTTYALVAELIDRLLSCKFFDDWKPSTILPPASSQVTFETSAAVEASTNSVNFSSPPPPPGFSVPPNNIISHPQAPINHSVNVAPTISGNRYPSGGVDRMLQTLDTSYHFMQNPGTPTQENGPVLHEPQSSRVAYQSLPQAPVPVTSYWGNSEVNISHASQVGLALSGESVLLSNKGTGSAHTAAVDWGSVETFDPVNLTDHYVAHHDPAILVQTPQQHHSIATESRERIVSGVSSNAPIGATSLARVTSPERGGVPVPPANLSWADKVRFNATSGPGGGSGGGVVLSVTSLDSSVVTSNNVAQPHHGGGDVFTTASQSQFLGNENNGEQGGGYRRRGGPGGRGYYGGERGRGREGYRGSGRGGSGMRGGGGPQNGQRGRGAYGGQN